LISEEGTLFTFDDYWFGNAVFQGGPPMHGIIYLVGLVVIVMALLSLVGLN
jgi:hypothetical protein